MKDLCFIDVETTGAVFGYHEIIDIAVLHTTPDAKQVIATFRRRIRPDHPERITDYARTLNGYRLELWESGEPSSRKLWTDFADFCKGAVPVCHNPSFERAFVTLAAASHHVLDLGLDYHWIGTESLGWPLYQSRLISKLSLESLCAFFEVGVEPHPHNALDGATACWRVYRALMERLVVSNLSPLYRE